ncbi:MAG TPA: hypothetical protein DDW76_10480 [Cyanobacteria bacterium UBA11369]|nr:hypothetical protein [Cyanobacteria bacterium UBA11371]HBE30923.1 hypothetical protein [Cyanobacteria bacterium UBA11368]HBE49197.1 hypothetical protein [Cyanobacteria bacterium UBA11369]
MFLWLEVICIKFQKYERQMNGRWILDKTSELAQSLGFGFFSKNSSWHQKQIILMGDLSCRVKITGCLMEIPHASPLISCP